MNILAFKGGHWGMAVIITAAMLVFGYTTYQDAHPRALTSSERMIQEVEIQKLKDAQKEFADAKTGDLIVMEGRTFAIIDHNRDRSSYSVQQLGPSPITFVGIPELANKYAKLIKNADTPEFAAAARMFLQDNGDLKQK